MSEGARSDVVESRGRLIAGRVVSVGAILLILVGGFAPDLGARAGVPLQLLSVIAAIAVAATLIPQQRGSVRLTLLWAALGFAVATGTIGAFSFGFIYVIAAILLIATIALTPLGPDVASRAEWRFAIAFFVTYPFTFVILFLL